MNNRFVKHHYYCTSPATEVTDKLAGGYFLEYNPNTKLYRINHADGVAIELMGSNRHRKALINQLNHFWRKYRK